MKEFQSPTEIALRNRINQLEAKLAWLDGTMLRPLEPLELLRPDMPENLTLAKSAELCANIQPGGRLEVDVKSYPSSGGAVVARYTEQLWRVSRSEALDIAALLHERFLHTLAAAIEEKEFIRPIGFGR